MPIRLNGTPSHVVLVPKGICCRCLYRSFHTTLRSNVQDKPRRALQSQSLRSLQTLRKYSSALNEVKHVAVLGGGVTGLSAAHYITQEFPNTKVTILESQPRVGGWLRSTEVDTEDGTVIFESGPRSLRLQGANGALMLRLVCSTDVAGSYILSAR